MNPHTLIRVTIILSLLISAVYAGEQALSKNDLAKIRRICDSLLGVPVTDSDPILAQLAPYRVRSKMDHRSVFCIGQRCYESVPLRGDAVVNYQFFHVPSRRGTKGGYFDAAPDIEMKGNNRIDAVNLFQEGKIVFEVTTTAKAKAR